MVQTEQGYEQKIETLKTIYSFIKDEKKTENDSIFTILGKGFHENTISDYLAYILNPQLNGIGVRPLQSVLDLLNCGLDIGEKDSIEIIREYTLLNNRRIDFLIKINEESIIAIEHKVFSEEHGDQTIDYANQIDREFGQSGYDFVFIFLTPTGKTPLSDRFTPINYAQLVAALQQVSVDYVKDIRKAILFNEFIFHLEGYFMKNESITLSKKSMLFLENYQLFNDLHKEFVSDYKMIFKYIESILSNYFPNDVGGEWEFDFKEDRGYHRIYRPSWKANGVDIHFELSMNIDSLIKKEITFMLDIEGSKKKIFSDKYDERLKNHVESGKGIKYRSGKRRDTFAHKNYTLLSEEHLENEAIFRGKIIEMVKDFSCLVTPLDNAILEFSK